MPGLRNEFEASEASWDPVINWVLEAILKMGKSNAEPVMVVKMEYREVKNQSKIEDA